MEGKNPKPPGKIFVALLPDDWLRNKIEKLNLQVIECYPSRSQESDGFDMDQFVRVWKSQSKWYNIHRQKSDSPPHPGKTIFAWANEEAKHDAEYYCMAKSGGLSSLGPSSHPVSHSGNPQ